MLSPSQERILVIIAEPPEMEITVVLGFDDELS